MRRPVQRAVAMSLAVWLTAIPVQVMYGQAAGAQGQATGVQGQATGVERANEFARVASLQLPQTKQEQLLHSLQERDYIGAETLLLGEVNHDPHSTQSARLLAFLGGVYFLHKDYLNAAVAWSKADGIVMLAPSLRFSLAMAYVHLGRSDWARKALLTLAEQEPGRALYPYWLGRLDYDAHLYQSAVERFEQAIVLDPDMAKAHDNLGLCFFYMNRNDDAAAQFRKAIELDRASPHPSAWPYLNLAIALEFTDRPEEALTNLHEAIALEPALPKAHVELGNVLERQAKLQAAVEQFEQAARLDPKYAEPHFALARLYRKLGKAELSRAEVSRYKQLHEVDSREGTSKE